MGSEAAEAPPPSAPPSSRVELNLTGFGKFYNVPINPTMVLMEKIMEFMDHRVLPPGASIDSCTVLETAGLGNLKVLLDLLDSKCSAEGVKVLDSKPSPEVVDKLVDSEAVSNTLVGGKHEVVWIHFGLETGATWFKVEEQAVNEASFRCADEMGWQPAGERIVEEDGPICNVRETVLPTGKIVAELTKLGFDAAVSYDAGRFVCNYVYYQSLRHAANHGTKCLFVHVPPFTVIGEQTQLEFVAALLKVVASIVIS
ncbi:unnamed protein product [Calypogeia fissa]